MVTNEIDLSQFHQNILKDLYLCCPASKIVTSAERLIMLNPEDSLNKLSRIIVDKNNSHNSPP